MSLPTANEICEHNDLDGQRAVKNFLGKDLIEAEELLKDNFFYYQADLMWMGRTAFQFYVKAALAYIKSDASESDYDILICFPSLLKSHHISLWANENDLGREIKKTIDYVLENWTKFQDGIDCDDEKETWLYLQLQLGS